MFRCDTTQTVFKLKVSVGEWENSVEKRNGTCNQSTERKIDGRTYEKILHVLWVVPDAVDEV